MASLRLVPLSEMTKPVVETPLDDLQAIDRLGLAMSILCDKSDGLGISAIQIGVNWNFFVVRESGVFEYYVNCDYKPLSEETYESMEGCLSIRDKYNKNRYFAVRRYSDIRFFGKKLVMNAKSELHLVDIDLNLKNATVLQHEADHCSNILISEHGIEIVRDVH